MSVLLHLCLLFPCASAQTPIDDDDGFDPDETVIVRQPNGLKRVGGSAHTIDEEELETFDYDDISNVLSQTPGVYVRSEDGYGLRPNIGMRGANSDRSAKITLLEDGLPLVPSPYAAPAAYYFPMATRMAGVEVFKGSAATQHGPQTVGGAINLLTREVPQRATGSVDLAMGQRKTARLHAYAGNGNARSGWLAEVSTLKTGGFKHLDGGGDTGFSRSDVMLKARVGSDPANARRHRLDLKLGMQNERSNETYLGLHPDDFAIDPLRRYAASSLDHMAWNRTQVELGHRYDAPGFRVRTVAYHHYLDRSWLKFNRFENGPDVHDLLQRPTGGSSELFLAILRGDEDTTTDAQRLRIGDNARTFHSFGVQSTMRLRSRGERFDSQLEASVRLHGDVVDRLHTERPYQMRGGKPVVDGSLITNLDAHSTATALAAHVHEDLAIGGLHLLPGLRSETIHTSSDEGDGLSSNLRTVLLPGFAVLQQLSENAQIFAGVHRGFSPVAPGQPPEVRPESSINVELGGRIGDDFANAEVVAYFNDYANLAGQCTLSSGCLEDQVDQQFNAGRVLVGGVEASGATEILLPNGWRIPVSGTYTLTLSRFQSDINSAFPQFGNVRIGDQLPYVPTHQGGARVGLDLGRLSFTMGLAGRTWMRDMAGSGAQDATSIPGRVLVDLALHAELTKDLSAYTTVNNATQTLALESWRPFGARPTAPRQVMVGMEFKR